MGNKKLIVAEDNSKVNTFIAEDISIKIKKAKRN